MVAAALAESWSDWPRTQAWSKQLAHCWEHSPAGRARHRMTFPKQTSASHLFTSLICLTLQLAVASLCSSLQRQKKTSHPCADLSLHLPQFLCPLDLQRNMPKGRHKTLSCCQEQPHFWHSSLNSPGLLCVLGRKHVGSARWERHGFNCNVLALDVRGRFSWALCPQ